MLLQKITYKVYKQHINFVSIFDSIQLSLYNQLFHMDQQKKFIPNSIISAGSSHRSKLSSCMSLERNSSGVRSISRKNSLHLIMSVEGSNKSDLFQQLINSGLKKPPANRQSYQLSTQDAVKNHEMMLQQIKRQSINNLPQSNCSHICTCYDTCDEQTCPCYDAKDEFCQKDSCCIKCIQTKLILMQSKRDICTCRDKCLQEYCSCFLIGGFCSDFCQCYNCSNKSQSKQRNIAAQQLKQRIARNDIYCTCKKTKCNKKYCSCYAHGIKCGPRCICQECTNCDYYPRPPSPKNNGMDVQNYNNPYTQQDIDKYEMPENIEFVPFNYKC